MNHHPRDTVGDHMTLALEYMAGAMNYTRFAGGSWQDRAKVAQYHGKALGHAFRAAELAYDLGQKHGPVWAPSDLPPMALGTYGGM